MTHLFDPPSVAPLADMPDAEDPQPRSVLTNPNFLSLWGSQIFSQIADKVYLVLVVAIVASQFQQNDEPISGWVSSIMVAFTIPAILFGTIAGVFVDRWSKKLTLAISNVLRGSLVLAIPLLLGSTEHLAPLGNSPAGFVALLAVTFLVSTSTQFFTPAEQSAIALVVEKPKLLAANSIYTTTVMAALILGFAAGEPLLAIANRLFAIVGLPDIGAEVVVGGSYLLAGAMLLPLAAREDRASQGHQEFHLWNDIREGVRYVSQQRTAQAALLQLVGAFSIVAALTVLSVRLAEVMPAIKSEQFGFLLAIASLGMAMGALLVGRFGQRLSRNALALLGSLGMAGCLAALACVTERLGMAGVAIAGLGVSAGLCVIPMQTAIQEETPEEMRGKVFGLQNNAVNVALSLPLALAGLAESCFGLQTTIFALSGIALAFGLLTWFVARSPRPRGAEL